MTITAIGLTNAGGELGNVTGWTSRSGGAPGVLTAPGGGTPHTGTYAFVGTASGSTAKWDQQVAIPGGLLAAVDTGRLVARAKAYHIGFSGDTDSGALYVEAIGADGTSIMSRTENAQSDPAAWTLDQAILTIPAGARYLRIGTNNTRVTGTELSTYWDDFVLEVSDSPNADFATGATIDTISKAGIVATMRPPSTDLITKAGVVVVMRQNLEMRINKAGIVAVMRPSGVSTGRRRMSLM